MSWLASNWRRVVTVVLVAATVSGWISSARYRGVADARAEDGRAQTEVIDVQRARIAADSAELARLEEESAAARAADSARIAALEAREAELRRETRELIASAEEEAAAHGGMVSVERYRSDMAHQERRVEVSDSVASVERAGRIRAEGEARGLAVHVTELTAQIGRLEARDVTRLAEIDALRGAVGARPGISIDIGSDWWKVGAGFLVGWAVSR